MPRSYEWSEGVAAAIEALPPWDGQHFWSLVAADGAAGAAHGRGRPLPLEVLAYLIREAYARGDRPVAERLFEVLWDRCADRIVYYARAYQGRLERYRTVEDVVVEVFATLGARLREASAPTFYEVCFLGGLKRLTLDRVQRLPEEPIVPLTVHWADADQDEQQDLPDPQALDPLEHSEESERRAALRQALPERLRGLPPRARETAWLLMQGRSEGEIASALGVSTRMVTNYKHAIRAALSGLDSG